MSQFNRKHFLAHTAVRILVVISLGLAVAPAINAQTTTGSVQGTVTDTSGAAIPGVQVTAQNVDTGISTSATSNYVGLYSIRFLPVGRYSIIALGKSFAEYKTNAFQLDINQIATINIAMQVQTATTKVEVQADVQPLLNQENPTLDFTVSGTSMANLPMDGRSFMAATSAIPGSIHSGGTATEQPVINGNRPETNSILLDGIDISDNLTGTNQIYTPSPDAIEQLKVITSNPGAEYSQANGGIIVVVTKSGTNQIHGNAFMQLENHDMDANTWSNKHTSGSSAAISPNTQTYFGGTVGGPIIKDKLFYFADYQGLRNHYTGTGFASLVPQAFLRGDLSALLAGPNPIQLYDSQNNFARFKNNQIPVRSSVAQFILAHPTLYPAPNITNPNPLDFTNDYIGPNDYAERTNQGDVKIDWKASSKDSVNGRFTMQSDLAGTVVSPLAVTIPKGPETQSYTALVLNEVHQISTEIVNEATIGFGRYIQGGHEPTDPSGLFGTSGNQKVGVNLPQGGFVGFAAQGFGGNEGLTSIGGTEQPTPETENDFVYGDQLSWQHGRHLIKLGAQFVRYQQNFSFSHEPILGDFGYAGVFTAAPDGTGGYDFADYLLGYAQELDALNGLSRDGDRQWRDGVFVQDDYQVTNKLVLNLGMRWDYSQPIYEQNNKEVNIGLTPTDIGTVYYAGQNGASRALYNPTYDQFLPRIGFAYSVTPKFVIRGGFGVSTLFEGMGVGGRLTQSPPYTNTYTITATNPTSTSGGTPLSVNQGLPANSTAGGNYNAWDTNDRPGWSNEFNLTTEYQLSNQSSIRVGYVGNTTLHLAIPMIATQLTSPGAPSRFQKLLTSTRLAVNQLQIVETRSAGISNYNALQAVYRIRNSRGIDFAANYTYSKTLSNGAEGWDGFNGTGSYGYYQQNYYDLAAEYGPSAADVRHVLSGSLVYEIPFGKGKQFAGKINRVSDLALGGWKLSGIASAYTGLPIDLYSVPAYSALVLSGSHPRPDHLRPMHIKNRSVIPLDNNWWGTDPSAVPCVSSITGGYLTGPGFGDPSTCAYGSESFTNFGDASNGSERGPKFRDVDLSAYKDFHITESHRVEFRADAFNAFNIANYGTPNRQVSDSGAPNANWGRITSTMGNQRILQLGLNYRF
jgi:hypothetical protein